MSDIAMPEDEDGAGLIALERRRQWRRSYPDEHYVNNELPLAAAMLCCAVADNRSLYQRIILAGGPLPEQFRTIIGKHHDRKERLIIAGALIASELDRILDEEDREGGQSVEQ